MAFFETANIFQRREVMFGESFLETLFIPIRMFFQGKDASTQYFDGVLNPILIIMLPFAFLNRELNRDKMFFLLFSVFFLFMAYFLTVIRIRYILNQETKDEFLSRNVGSYPAMQYINKNLPDDVKIFLMFLGRRGYYLNRPYYHEKSFGMNTINNMVKASQDKQDFQAYLQSLDCTHILMRTELVDKYLHDNFPKKTIVNFLNLVKECWSPIYESNGYAVWDIGSKPKLIKRPNLLPPNQSKSSQPPIYPHFCP